ncbi:MAG: cyanophycin synthetase [Pseudomonadota bacterium]|nr:cyanophycin synthetase [Pseudomonadota bacterium]
MPAILERIGPLLGAEVIFEPEFGIVGLVRFPNGRQSYFWHNKFNLNSVSSARIAQDKGYTTHFLSVQGFRVPRSRTFFREAFRLALDSDRGTEAAMAYAHSLGWPVYVKPCRRSQGDGVSMAMDPAELVEATARVLGRDRMMIVQEACPGRDYRIVTLDGEVINAYERVPLEVVGDGRSSVAALLETLQTTFDASGRDTRIPVEDERIHTRLRRQGLTVRSVLPEGARLRLLDIANLSCGGTTIDITERLHPSVAALAARVAVALDLRFAGIDLLMPDATAPLEDYVVLEVNSAPGLDHYGTAGPDHQAFVDALYLKVLRAVERGPA